MERPNVDLAQALAVELGAGYTYQVNVFAGPIMPASQYVPQEAIFCMISGPGNLIRVYGGTVIRQTDITIRIRAERGNYDETQQLAREVWLVTKNMDTTPGSSLEEYMAVVSTEAEPIEVLRDDQEHWGWSVNVRMDYVEG